MMGRIILPLLKPAAAPAYANDYYLDINDSATTNESIDINGQLASGSTTGVVSIRFNSDALDDHRNMLFASDDPTTTSDYLMFRTSYSGDSTAARRDKVYMLIRSGGSTVLSCYGSTNLSASTWYTVYWVMTTGGIKCYLGTGASVAEETLGFLTGDGSTQYGWFDEIGDTNGEWNIGGQHYNNSYSTSRIWKGKLDVLELYSDSKTSGEITTLYDSGNDNDHSGETDIAHIYNFEQDLTDDVGGETGNHRNTDSSNFIAY